MFCENLIYLLSDLKLVLYHIDAFHWELEKMGKLKNCSPIKIDSHGLAWILQITDLSYP